MAKRSRAERKAAKAKELRRRPLSLQAEAVAYQMRKAMGLIPDFNEDMFRKFLEEGMRRGTNIPPRVIASPRWVAELYSWIDEQKAHAVIKGLTDDII